MKFMRLSLPLILFYYISLILLFIHSFIFPFIYLFTQAQVDVEEYPWQREVIDGRAHHHAFKFSPEYNHTCSVSQERDSEYVIHSNSNSAIAVPHLA